MDINEPIAEIARVAMNTEIADRYQLFKNKVENEPEQRHKYPHPSLHFYTSQLHNHRVRTGQKIEIIFTLKPVEERHRWWSSVSCQDLSHMPSSVKCILPSNLDKVGDLGDFGEIDNDDDAYDSSWELIDELISYACNGYEIYSIRFADQVLFKRFRDHGDVIAIFPNLRHSTELLMSYMHIGQHSGCSPELLDGDCDLTELATLDEYTPLLRELSDIGYKLQVLNCEEVHNECPSS